MDKTGKKLSYYEKLPLPPNYFKCPQLSPEEAKHLLFMADSNAIDVVDYATIDGGPLQWTLEGVAHDVCTYRSEDIDAPPGTRTWAWTTEIHGTLEEVAEMLRTDIDDPDQYRGYCRKFHMGALDGVRLYCLERSPQHYVGIHWTVNDLPGLIKNKDICVVKNRDWCFLESHSSIELADGRRGWVRAMTSIELHCCPDLKHALGFIRANYHRSGFVFLESKTRPGYLDVIQLQQIDFRGTLTDLFASIEVAERKRDMQEFEQNLRIHRLSQSSFLSEHMLVPRNARSKCHVCRQKFGITLRRHRCRKCGEVVCSSCSKIWKLKVSGIDATLRVCSPCAMTDYVPRTSGVLILGGSSQEGGSDTFAHENDDTMSIHSSTTSVRLTKPRMGQSVISKSSLRSISQTTNDDEFSQYSDSLDSIPEANHPTNQGTPRRLHSHYSQHIRAGSIRSSPMYKYLTSPNENFSSPKANYSSHVYDKVCQNETFRPLQSSKVSSVSTWVSPISPREVGNDGMIRIDFSQLSFK